MGFLSELGNLIQKYDVQILPIQIEQNIRKLNQRHNTNLKVSDLPPSLIVFKTKEGDYIPTNFGPISIDNEEKNCHFININDRNKVLNLIERKQQKKVINTTKGIFIIGPMFNKENCNIDQFNDFLSKNLNKIRSYNTSNNYIKKFLSNQDYKTGNVKLTTKIGKDIISNLQNYMKECNVIVLLNGCYNASETKKLIEFAQKNKLNIIDEKDF